MATSSASSLAGLRTADGRPKSSEAEEKSDRGDPGAHSDRHSLEQHELKATSSEILTEGKSQTMPEATQGGDAVTSMMSDSTGNPSPEALTTPLFIFVRLPLNLLGLEVSSQSDRWGDVTYYAKPNTLGRAYVTGARAVASTIHYVSDAVTGGGVLTRVQQLKLSIRGLMSQTLRAYMAKDPERQDVILLERSSDIVPNPSQELMPVIDLWMAQVEAEVAQIGGWPRVHDSLLDTENGGESAAVWPSLLYPLSEEVRDALLTLPEGTAE